MSVAPERGAARRGLRPERVVAEAATIADAEGLDAVTVARLAQELGVRPPSLYKHVAGRDAVVRGVALIGLRDLGSALAAAAVGRAGEDALVAFAHAYRTYALAHPGSYAATVRAPAAGDAEHEALAAAVMETVLAVLRAWDLEGEDVIHAARALRSALHGFVTLEAAGGFGLPADRERSFEELVRTLAAGLSARPGTAAPASPRGRRG